MKEKNKTKIITVVITAAFSLVSSLLTGSYYKIQLNQIQIQNQKTTYNIINTLGENAAGKLEISENSDIDYIANELTKSYLNIDKDNEGLQKQIDTLKNQNEELRKQNDDLKNQNETSQNQIKNLKDFLFEKHSINEIDDLVAKGYVKEVLPVRLDSIERLDGENYEEVATMKDLYGTTHSVSYKLQADRNNGVSWIKFKLDGKYDKFTANIATSEDTGRNSCLSVEIYVDENMVSRADNIIRDENLIPINAPVRNGKTLMIKVIGTSNTYSNICFITDAELTMLE